MAGVEGRVALVTGGGRGIGRATAELLASRGAKVMCVARSRQELSDVGLEYSVADLGSPEGCAHAVARQIPQQPGNARTDGSWRVDTDRVRNARRRPRLPQGS